MRTVARKTIELVEFSPEDAKREIERNVPEYQRKVKKSVVSKYANQMRSGAWDSGSVQPIHYDTEGRLMDGQHRMMAIAESGVHCLLWVVRDCETASYKFLDHGKTRGADDIYSEVNRNDAAVARALLFIRSGNLHAVVSAYLPQDVDSSEATVADYAVANLDDIRWYISAMKRLRGAFGINLGGVSVCIPFLHEASRLYGRGFVEEFIEKASNPGDSFKAWKLFREKYDGAPIRKETAKAVFGYLMRMADGMNATGEFPKSIKNVMQRFTDSVVANRKVAADA